MFSRVLRIPSTWRIARNLSTEAAPSLMVVDINDKNGIATLKMYSKPVNSMTLNFLKDFCESMDSLEKEKVKGIVLTSSVKNVFSAGLNFEELYKPDEARINAFWLWFQEAWIKLYGSSIPTAALINGHAPAGGCVLAISCEYRVMLPNFTIGLNEAPVGIVLPGFVMACARNTLSLRKAEMALTLGTLFTTEEALDVGFVDEIAEDEATAFAKCEKFLLKSAKIPSMARGICKQSYRKETLDMLKNPQSRSLDAKTFIDHILRPSTQQQIADFAANVKNAKK